MPLLRAELKKTALAIPRLLGMALLLALLIFGLILGAGKLFEQGGGSKMKLALTMPEGDPSSGVAGVVMSTLRSMESVSSSLEIVKTGEAEALALVRSGEAVAAVLVPEGFIDGIIYGKNTPALVVLRGEGDMQSMLLRGTADAAADILKVTQCGLYAIYHAAELSDMDMAYADALVQQVDMLYIRAAMGREDVIAKRSVSAFGALTTEEYITASALFLFMLLLGTALTGVFRYENGDFYRRLRALGRGGAGVALCKLCSLLLLNLIFTLLLALIGLLCGLPVNTMTFIRLLPAIFTVSCMQLAVCTLVQDGLAAVLIQFLLGAALAFMAGAIVPAAFLPELLSKISRWLPAYPLLLQVRHAVADTGGAELLCCAWGLGLAGLSLLFMRWRIKRI